ncbi:hypothetical protein JTB14_035194 [Gonioctena quinquepunctata]|nr:hypothetical protein JTB14_035194 [Gonioctena quinquepunctata]
MSQDFEIIRKASILSVISEKRNESITFTKKVNSAPKDTYYLGYLFFFAIGFYAVVPILFFGSAANYWLHKFRNTTDVTNRAEDRTSLQSLYQSVSMVAQNISSILCTIAATYYSRKFDARLASTFSLSVMAVVFVILSVFTQINTDSWQTEFFVLTMLLLAVNCGALAHFQVFTTVILAKFPSNFLKIFLIGQTGGIFTDTLQVISISLTDSPSDGALIYFTTGTVLVFAAICLFLIIKYTPIYAHYDNDTTMENENNDVSLSEMKEVAKLIWPILFIFIMSFLSNTCVHPAVTSLVVSENDENGGAWEKKYFTPVIAFTLAHVCNLVGRLISKGRVTRSNYPFWVCGAVVRFVIAVAIIMLCNAQPRSHLPVVFNRDWQYISFIILYNISGGFLLNLCFLSLNKLSENRPEVALKLVTLAISVITAVFSVNGVLIVKLL